MVEATEPTVEPEVVDEDEPNLTQSILFDNLIYMGRAVIGSSVSNIEANAIIGELYEYHTDNKVTLAIGSDSTGSIIVLDKNKEVLHKDRIKTVLYCTKSAALPQCFAYTSGHKERGMYYCHAFKCKDKEVCMRVLNTMGSSFNRGLTQIHAIVQMAIYDIIVVTPSHETEWLSIMRSIQCQDLPSDGRLEYDFEVSLEILEECNNEIIPVAQDKDLFKLRQNRVRHFVLTVTQTSSSVLILERCCGLFLAPSHHPQPSDFVLLDMPVEMETGTTGRGPLYMVKGIWNPCDQPCGDLNDISNGGRDVSIAIDVVASGVVDPIRFTSKTKFKIYQESERFYLYSRYTSQQQFTVALKPNHEDPHRRFGLAEVKAKMITATPSKLRSLFSGIGLGPGDDDISDITESEDEEPLISGTVDTIEQASEETLKRWRTLLESWTDHSTRPNELVKLSRKGIPNSLRKEVWLKLGGISEKDIEENYIYLYDECLHHECRHEQVILWDLNRTFPGNEFYHEGQDGQRQLYHVCKSYAGFDPEVGYCQGLSFIVAVLLLHLPEEKAFALFTVIMNEYNFRDLFKKGFQMLQLKFFILEKLLEDQMPDLWEHFQDHDLNTQMYASQWFLTLFSAKFPLGLVFRIVDMFLTEGPDTLFKIALALLKLSKSELLSHDFEGMLKYFRVSLPKRFMNKKHGQKLLSTASSAKIQPGKVALWEAEFHKLQDEKRSLEDPMRQLEHQLKQSVEANHRLEQENDMLVQRLMLNQVNMRHQLDELEKRNMDLKRDFSKLNTKYEAVCESNDLLSAEILKTKNLYHSSLAEGDEERSRHKLTIQEYQKVCRKLEEQHEKEKQELNLEVLEVKARLGCGIEGEVDSKTLSSEQRLRELELELAKTKLCLVEANCKAQEYEHRNTELYEKLRNHETSVIGQLKAKLNR